MPSENKAPAVTSPNYFRPYTLVSGVDVPEFRILKGAGDFPGAALATSPGDLLVGVTVEPMTVGGPTRSVQTQGRARVEAGEAFPRLSRLTTDAQGRAVVASEGQSIIGWAETESTGEGDIAAVELALQASSVGNVIMQEFVIDHEMLTAEATNQTFNVGAALPANARILVVETELDEVFAGGDIAGAELDVGVSGALDQIVDGRNIFTAAPEGILLADGDRPAGTYGGQQLQARITTTTGDVDEAETGEVTIRVFYAVAA